MDLEPNQETKAELKSEKAQSPSRRKFLRSSSTAALVTSLAAQPVWGQCTVSGNQSGASSSPTNGDACFIPPPLYSAGRSPGFWTEAVFGPGNAVISAFSSHNGTQAADLRCYIEGVMMDNFYTVPIPGTDLRSEPINVYAALQSPGGTGGNNWNLAAIWLDAYFGFFDGAILPGGGSSSTPEEWAQAWVDHFFALYEISNHSDSVFDTVYGESSTLWTLPPGYSCQEPDEV